MAGIVAFHWAAGESVVEAGFVRRVVVDKLAVMPDGSVVAELVGKVGEERSCSLTDFGIVVMFGVPEIGTEEDIVVVVESTADN